MLPFCGETVNILCCALFCYIGLCGSGKESVGAFWVIREWFVEEHARWYPDWDSASEMTYIVQVGH